MNPFLPRPYATSLAELKPRPTNHLLVTGATGFLGKVVLRQLVERKEELGVERITLLVRPQKKKGREVAPRERFRQIVKKSALFADLKEIDPRWSEMVDVVACDLAEASGGVPEEALVSLRRSVTHVLHCAASVEFDRPVAEAAASNVTSALNVLELARTFVRLQGMVSVSTAYTTVWRPGSIEETLAPLPRPAEEYHQAILEGSRSEAEMLAETGHPNTYTFTKCIAEHLICARRGDVPLTIVRPSIISASWAAPFPGWIDSPAALAGCLLYASLGLVPAYNANPSTRLDVVPVDWVAHRVIEATMREAMPRPGEPTPIRFAAMGIERAMHIEMTVEAGRRFFHVRPGPKRVGPMSLSYDERDHARRDLYSRKVPTLVLKLALKAAGQTKNANRLTRADDKVQYLNKAFAYFTHHTFDFRPSRPFDAPGYEPLAYAEIICRGMYKHLLLRDDTALPLAGPDHDDARNDLRWVIEKENGNAVVRALGLGLRQVFRKCTSGVSFDRTSFERAMAATSPDSLLVLAPSHRSYFDFFLTSYLCFQHPELGIPVPDIVAADIFAKIPVASPLLKRAGAFFIPRGVGREVPEVSEQLREVVRRKSSLMFFAEGQRSRARRTLPPKRGILRGLQATGRTFTVLPIAISYDRVPEEAALARELDGGEKPKMSLGSITRWLAKLARGGVELGRIHVACGEPLVMNEKTDVRALARKLACEQQRATVITRFHLRTFLANARAHAGQMHLEGVTEEWLASAIEARGGRVLSSSLEAPKDCLPALERSLRNQWMHWFFADAVRLYPDNAVIEDHVERHGWIPKHDVASDDPRVKQVVDALFAPVLDDHATTLRAIASAAWRRFTPRSVVQAFPAAHLPIVEDAFDFLTTRDVLTSDADGHYARGEHANGHASGNGHSNGNGHKNGDADRVGRGAAKEDPTQARLDAFEGLFRRFTLDPFRGASSRRRRKGMES
jgi:thioester reductase-like protein/1-acyl-sn-glycerol-3-phosphate acyltransferase